MFKKMVLSVLILAQLSFAGGALAAETAALPTATNPELTLFENSIAITGENLPRPEMQMRLAQAFSEYEKTADPAGQTERMEEALVALNLYTSQQAHQLAREAKTLSAGATEANFSQTTSAEILRLASQYPAGAQFSACDLAMGLGIGAGFFGGIVGGIVWSVGAQAQDSNGNDVPDATEVRVGEIITGAAVLAGVDAIVIWAFSNNCGSGQ